MTLGCSKLPYSQTGGTSDVEKWNRNQHTLLRSWKWDRDILSTPEGRMLIANYGLLPLENMQVKHTDFAHIDYISKPLTLSSQNAFGETGCTC